MDKKDKTQFIVKCPYCDTEYLTGEIYIPKYFLGQPDYIEKDINGTILDWDGIAPDLSETFECTKCKHPFKVQAEINFTTSKLDIFDTEFISEKYSDRIMLKEE